MRCEGVKQANGRINYYTQGKLIGYDDPEEKQCVDLQVMEGKDPTQAEKSKTQNTQNIHSSFYCGIYKKWMDKQAKILNDRDSTILEDMKAIGSIMLYSSLYGPSKFDYWMYGPIECGDKK